MTLGSLSSMEARANPHPGSLRPPRARTRITAASLLKRCARRGTASLRRTHRSKRALRLPVCSNGLTPAMDADTGERGENAGRDRCTQYSSGGLAAVVALEGGRYGADKPHAGKELLIDGLQVMEFVNDDLVMSERCYAVVCQGHGAARSMAWFSPTKWECIAPHPPEGGAGERRYRRVLRALDRILALHRGRRLA